MEKIIPLEGFQNIPSLFGTYNRNVKLISKIFSVRIIARDSLRILGETKNVEQAAAAFLTIKDRIAHSGSIGLTEIESILEEIVKKIPERQASDPSQEEQLPTKPRTPGQKEYMKAIRNHEIVFSIGPAGTGKTFLAVAMAVDALKQGLLRRIVLVRPAVEAGEKLGFLPGDFQAKINPYLRPLYDALNIVLDYNQLRKYMERDIIEIAPLAYMRGRTLESSFVILDEAQNTTSAQMKMFLTRLGFNSKMVVTGDITQVDLHEKQLSGLVHAQALLQNVPGICFFYFTSRDIVRHHLVQRIVEAYEQNQEEGRGSEKKT